MTAIAATSPWPKVKFKYVASLVSARADSRPEGSPYVGLENIESKTGKLLGAQGLVDKEFADGISTVNLFEAGDVLFGKLRPYLAKAWVSTFAGACTTEALVLRPHPCISSDYLCRVMLSPDFIREVDTTTFGSKMPRADWADIGNIEILVPPLAIQDSISQSLRGQTSSIEALIESKARLLDCLAEKRRALIAHAVTRGLEPKVSLRESGIEWLDAIPSHWRILPLRRVIRRLDQGWSPVASNIPAADDEYGVLKLSAIKNGVFLPEENKALLSSDDIPPGLTIKAGDVFLTRANTPSLVGDAAMVEGDHPNLVFSDLIYRLQVNPEIIDPRWLVLALISDIGRRQVEAEAKGSSGSMVKLAQDQVLGLLIPVPPIEEQRAIVCSVNESTQKIRQLAASTRATVDLLIERRTSLIATAVLGEDLSR